MFVLYKYLCDLKDNKIIKFLQTTLNFKWQAPTFQVAYDEEEDCYQLLCRL